MPRVNYHLRARIFGQQGGPSGQAAQLLVQCTGRACVGDLVVPERDGVFEAFSASVWHGQLEYADEQVSFKRNFLCFVF